MHFGAGMHLFHTPLGHFMKFYPSTSVPEGIFSIPLSAKTQKWKFSGLGTKCQQFNFLL
jgi:hypothetical protein